MPEAALWTLLALTGGLCAFTTYRLALAEREAEQGRFARYDLAHAQRLSEKHKAELEQARADLLLTQQALAQATAAGNRRQALMRASGWHNLPDPPAWLRLPGDDPP